MPHSPPPPSDPVGVDPRWRREPGGIHVLQARTRIPRPRAEVFRFFAAAENLERITPPELRFGIVTPAPIHMESGTLIDYRLSLWGLRFPWRTEITEWDPPRSFADSQITGPFHTWIHLHELEEEDRDGRSGGATIMTDLVRYRLPLWPLGEAALPLVSRQLHRIFRYRALVIRNILGRGDPGSPSSSVISGAPG